MSVSDRIKLFRSDEIWLPLWVGQGIMCPICGVVSNPYPCYNEGDGTAVTHRLSYCGHRLENNPIRMGIWSIPKEL